MNFIPNLINDYKSPIKYILLSGAIYGYIFALLWVLDSFTDINPRISYALILGSAYIIDYTFTGTWVFQKNLNWKSLIRFLVFILFSYVLNVLVFSIIYSITGLAVPSAILVASLLFLPRYFLSKKFVYRN